VKTVTKRRAKNPTEPAPEGFPMGDCSQVWWPWPQSWPQPSQEQMAKDARRRAAFYTNSPFWGRSTRSLVLGPKVQQELFA